MVTEFANESEAGDASEALAHAKRRQGYCDLSRTRNVYDVRRIVRTTGVLRMARLFGCPESMNDGPVEEGKSLRPGRSFSSAVDALLHQALDQDQ